MTVKLVNICPIFISEDVEKTLNYYRDKLGFKYAAHLDKEEKFGTLYKDDIEIVVVEKKKGNILSNRKRFGSGFDAYIDTEEVKQLDVLYAEFLKKGVKIVEKPHMTDYGSYEFLIEDIDGRLIGFGRIAKKEVFFKESNYLE